MSLTTTDAFDASKYWQLSEMVSLRDEEFGALAYHHVNRRLVFLKSRELVEIVRHLGDFECADDAVRALTPADQHDRYVTALGALEKSALIRGR